MEQKKTWAQLFQTNPSTVVSATQSSELPTNSAPPKQTQSNNSAISKTNTTVNNKIQYPNSKTNVSVYSLENWENDSTHEDQSDRMTSDIKEKWRNEQVRLSAKLIEYNDFEFQLPTNSAPIPPPTGKTWSSLFAPPTPSAPKPILKYIGGVDISFVKDSKIDACACIVVVEYPSLKIVWEAYSMIKLTAPYIAGLLGFREVPHILQLLDKMKKDRPDIFPQLLMVDGNGVLHMRNFGSACHLGVLSGIPCMGIAKKLLYTDGITETRVAQALRDAKPKKTADLYGDSGKRLAIAFKGPSGSPLYISVGHKVDLDTCEMLALSCMVPGHNLPEPVYQADFLSREFLRLNYHKL